MLSHYQHFYMNRFIIRIDKIGKLAKLPYQLEEQKVVCLLGNSSAEYCKLPEDAVTFGA